MYIWLDDFVQRERSEVADTWFHCQQPRHSGVFHIAWLFLCEASMCHGVAQYGLQSGVRYPNHVRKIRVPNSPIHWYLSSDIKAAKDIVEPEWMFLGSLKTMCATFSSVQLLTC